MSNIDNIIDKLQAETNQKIVDIKKDSDLKVKGVKAEIIGKANDEKNKILSDAKNKAESIFSRIKDNAEIRIRDERLKERQNLIDRVFSLALDKMNSKSDEEFISDIKKVLGEVEGKEFLLQVPKSRLKTIKQAGLNVKLDEENFVNDGFILVSDRINYNYSYSDILKDKREELGPELIKFLSE